MEFKTRRRNTSVAILRRNYLNKKSGKVTASKKEIQERFDDLDWNDQKKILLDYLQSGKTDREWASGKLINYWDPCFEPIVKDILENLNEKCFAWSIIRFFPKEYLKQNMEALSEGRNYYFICLRLSDDEDFEIDESRIREIDYLNVLSKSSRTVTDEQVERLYFSLVSKLCTGDYDWHRDAKWPKTYYSNEIPSLMKIQMIQTAIRKIGELHKINVYTKIIDWENGVRRNIGEIIDYRYLQDLGMDKDNYELRKLALTKRFYYDHLDSQFKFKGDDPEIPEPLHFSTSIEEDPLFIYPQLEDLPF